MSENTKRYYWMKLNENFFNSDDMKIIKKHDNGPEYIIFWQQLLLKAISSRTPGVLKYKEDIPYSPELLATITDTDIDIVKGAISLFLKLDMIAILETGEIWIKNIHEFLYSSGDEAVRKRLYRSKKRGELMGHVPDMSGTTVQEIEKEIDIEKEKENREGSAPAQSDNQEKIKYFDSDYVRLHPHEFQRLVSRFGESFTKACIQKLNNYKGSTGKKYKSDYLAILNWVVDDLRKKGIRPGPDKQKIDMSSEREKIDFKPREKPAVQELKEKIKAVRTM